jgi:hypothetical protein
MTVIHKTLNIKAIQLNISAFFKIYLVFPDFHFYLCCAGFNTRYGFKEGELLITIYYDEKKIICSCSSRSCICS